MMAPSSNSERNNIMEKNFSLQNLNIEDLELDVEDIEITPVIDLSDFSDAQDLPETGASVGYKSCSKAAD
jgi:hypothetical protein